MVPRRIPAIGYPASFGGSSSGRTTDSDSVYLGSNPSPPAKLKAPLTRGFVFAAPAGVAVGPIRA
jgi:hypothetical protein